MEKVLIQDGNDRKFVATSPGNHAGIVRLSAKLTGETGQPVSIREATDLAILKGLKALGIEVDNAQPG